jgi:hypothetical protein
MAVKTYSYAKNKNDKLSEHFSVWEFASSDGSKLYTDKILIDSDLVTMLEKLYAAMNCSKMNINSGYRCAEHDKAVGGSGSGQHVNGKAADIKCYDKDGNIIDARYVCCMATEVGFKGVANIKTSPQYTSVHVDTRTTKYYGDESIVDNLRWNSIWYRNSKYTDFYVYFNLNRSDVLSKFNYSSSSSTSSTSTTSTKTTTATIIKNSSTTSTYKLKIKSGKWNIRSGPSMSSSVVTTVSGGISTTYTSNSDWYYIPSLKGWISATAKK